MYTAIRRYVAARGWISSQSFDEFEDELHRQMNRCLFRCRPTRVKFLLNVIFTYWLIAVGILGVYAFYSYPPVTSTAPRHSRDIAIRKSPLVKTQQPTTPSVPLNPDNLQIPAVDHVKTTVDGNVIVQSTTTVPTVTPSKTTPGHSTATTPANATNATVQLTATKPPKTTSDHSTPTVATTATATTVLLKATARRLYATNATVKRLPIDVPANAAGRSTNTVHKSGEPPVSRIPALKRNNPILNNHLSTSRIRNKKIPTRSTTLQLPALPELFTEAAYAQWSPDGNFIPSRRIVHLDLKGAPYKVHFYRELFAFFHKIGATGILIEWEDMFPYEGILRSARSELAYTIDEVEEILRYASLYHLQVIPLVQTMGHLEWVLKLPEFANLRDDERYSTTICAANATAYALIIDMVDQVAAVHKKFGMEFFHMGADEVFNAGSCDEAREMVDKFGKEGYVLWHIERVAKYIRDQHKTSVLAWHDMLIQALTFHRNRNNITVTKYVEPVLWAYAENLREFYLEDTWRALHVFPRVWGCSAIKGADGPSQYLPNPQHYVRNNADWSREMTENANSTHIQGIIFSAWSRFDHFAQLAELMPVAIPSLAQSMETIRNGGPATGVKTAEWLNCTISPYRVPRACDFPGFEVYRQIRLLGSSIGSFREFRNDSEVRGWFSRFTRHSNFSSAFRLENIRSRLTEFRFTFKQRERSLRASLREIYFDETVNEFIFTYLQGEMDWLNLALQQIEDMLQQTKYRGRPFARSGVKLT